MFKPRPYDALIAGGSFAGLSAAMDLGRAPLGADPRHGVCAPQPLCLGIARLPCSGPPRPAHHDRDNARQVAAYPTIDFLGQAASRAILSPARPCCSPMASPTSCPTDCAIDKGQSGSTVTTDEMKTTSVAGAYAAGDITRLGHTVTFACADRVMAALAIHRSLAFGMDI